MSVPQKPRIVDDPDAQETYVSKLVAASFDGGAIVLTLGNTRLNMERVDQPPTPGQIPSVHVATRIALAPSAAMEVASAIQGLIAVANKGPGGIATPMPMGPKLAS